MTNDWVEGKSVPRKLKKRGPESNRDVRKQQTGTEQGGRMQHEGTTRLIPLFHILPLFYAELISKGPVLRLHAVQLIEKLYSLGRLGRPNPI